MPTSSSISSSTAERNDLATAQERPRSQKRGSHESSEELAPTNTTGNRTDEVAKETLHESQEAPVTPSPALTGKVSKKGRARNWFLPCIYPKEKSTVPLGEIKA